MQVVEGSILALDLSTTVGWAFGQLGAQAPIFGCWRLPPTGGEGGRYVALENQLAETIEVLKPTRLVLEASLSLQALAASSTMQVARQQITLRGIAYMEAYRASIPVSEIDSYTVRRELLGTGRFAKETVKREVVRYCWGQGIKVNDHNAADAVCVWLWLRGQLTRNASPVAGPLFVQRRA